jgi:hypothetical protein
VEVRAGSSARIELYERQSSPVATRDGRCYTIAVCDTPAGERTVVRSDDAAVLERMMREEFVGRVVEAAGAGFSLRG